MADIPQDVVDAFQMVEEELRMEQERLRKCRDLAIQWLRTSSGQEYGLALYDAIYGTAEEGGDPL